jgi:hypothetical protein
MRTDLDFRRCFRMILVGRSKINITNTIKREWKHIRKAKLCRTLQPYDGYALVDAENASVVARNVLVAEVSWMHSTYEIRRRSDSFARLVAQLSFGEISCTERHLECYNRANSTDLSIWKGTLTAGCEERGRSRIG